MLNLQGKWNGCIMLKKANYLQRLHEQIIDLYKKSCNKLNNSTKTLNTFTEETIGKCPLCNSSIVKRKANMGFLWMLGI